MITRGAAVTAAFLKRESAIERATRTYTVRSCSVRVGKLVGSFMPSRKKVVAQVQVPLERQATRKRALDGLRDFLIKPD